MDNLGPLRRLLADSSDPDNPPAEQIAELFDRLRRVAVVGMSRDVRKAARRVPSYLAAKGYDVIPVNPYADRVLGKAARYRLADVDEHIDMVLVFRPSMEAGKALVEAAARPDRPAIWLQEGIRADADAAAARAQGRMVVQDLCAYKVHRSLNP